MEPPPLAQEIAGSAPLMEHLSKNFNEPQLAAIKWSCAHNLRQGLAEFARDVTQLICDSRFLRPWHPIMSE